MTAQSNQPQAQPQPEQKNELHLKIMNAETIVFESQVKAVSSSNEKGPFDILPYHSNFIAIIKDFLTVHLLDGTKKEMKIDVGILKTSGNETQIFLGIQVDKPSTPIRSILQEKPAKRNPAQPPPVQAPQPIPLSAKNNPLYGG